MYGQEFLLVLFSFKRSRGSALIVGGENPRSPALRDNPANFQLSSTKGGQKILKIKTNKNNLFHTFFFDPFKLLLPVRIHACPLYSLGQHQYLQSQTTLTLNVGRGKAYIETHMRMSRIQSNGWRIQKNGQQIPMKILLHYPPVL